MGTQILVGDGFSTSSAVLLCGKRSVGRATGKLGEASALGSVVVNIGGMLAGRLVQARGEGTARALDTVFHGNACISSEVNRRTSSVASILVSLSCMRTLSSSHRKPGRSVDAAETLASTSVAECAEELSRMWEYVERVSPGVLRDEPASWYPAGYKYPGTKGGKKAGEEAAALGRSHCEQNILPPSPWM
jgi:hypothetical protein